MDATAWARLASADTALPFTFCSREEASCRDEKLDQQIAAGLDALSKLEE
jgi:hypothetical protein